MYLHNGKIYAEHELRSLMAQIDADIRSGIGSMTVGERYQRRLNAIAAYQREHYPNRLTPAAAVYIRQGQAPAVAFAEEKANILNKVFAPGPRPIDGNRVGVGIIREADDLPPRPVTRGKARRRAPVR